MSDSEVEIGEFGPTGAPISVRLKKYRGRHFIDVRRHLAERPTRKGIMLSGSNFEALVAVLSANQAAIAQWFGSEEGDILAGVQELHAMMQERRKEEAQKLPSARVSESYMPSSAALFSVSGAGNAVDVTLNPTHPIVSELDLAVSDGNKEAARNVLARILQASFHAVASAGSGGIDLEAAEDHAGVLGILLRRMNT